MTAEQREAPQQATEAHVAAMHARMRDLTREQLAEAFLGELRRFYDPVESAALFEELRPAIEGHSMCAVMMQVAAMLSGVVRHLSELSGRSEADVQGAVLHAAMQLAREFTWCEGAASRKAG